MCVHFIPYCSFCCLTARLQFLLKRSRERSYSHDNLRSSSCVNDNVNFDQEMDINCLTIVTTRSYPRPTKNSILPLLCGQQIPPTKTARSNRLQLCMVSTTNDSMSLSSSSSSSQTKNSYTLTATSQQEQEPWIIFIIITTTTNIVTNCHRISTTNG
jgi:hypothetical protein